MRDVDGIEIRKREAFIVLTQSLPCDGLLSSRLSLEWQASLGSPPTKEPVRVPAAPGALTRGCTCRGRRRT